MGFVFIGLYNILVWGPCSGDILARPVLYRLIFSGKYRAGLMIPELYEVGTAECESPALCEGIRDGAWQTVSDLYLIIQFLQKSLPSHVLDHERRRNSPVKKVSPGWFHTVPLKAPVSDWTGWMNIESSDHLRTICVVNLYCDLSFLLNIMCVCHQKCRKISVSCFIWQPYECFDVHSFAVKTTELNTVD